MNPFDDMIRNSMQEFKPTPPQGMFSGIQQSVGTGATKSLVSKALLKWGISAITAGVIGTGAYIFIKNDQTPQHQSSVAGNHIQKDGKDPKSSEQQDRADIDKTLPGNSLKQDEYNGRQSNINPNVHSSANSPGRNIKGSSADPSSNNSPAGNQAGNSNSQSGNNNAAAGNIAHTIQMKIEGPRELTTSEAGTYTLNTDIVPDQVTLSVDGGEEVIVRNNIYKTSFAVKGAHQLIFYATKDGRVSSVVIKVKVKELKADFEYSLTNFPNIRFINKSLGCDHYIWDFGDGEKSIVENPDHTYMVKDSPFVTVKLRAGKKGVDQVKDKSIRIPLFQPEEPVIPNAFTPDGDGINDRFVITVKNILSFHLVIADGNGNVVFESFDSNSQWDGTYMGAPTPAGTYSFNLTYQTNNYVQPRSKYGKLLLNR